MHRSRVPGQISSVARRLAAVGTGFLLLGVAIQAALLGAGETYVSELERRSESTAPGPLMPTGQMKRASDLPWGLGEDADFAYLNADLLLKRYLEEAEQERADRDTGEAAVAGFRQALRLRPVWARAWARLAYARAVLGEHDAELSEALATALRFGPHETEVREMVAWVGLAVWDDLPQQTRQLVWPVITRAAGDPALGRNIVRWSFESGLADYLMPYFDESGLRQLEALRRQREAQARKNAAERQR